MRISSEHDVELYDPDAGMGLTKNRPANLAVSSIIIAGIAFYLAWYGNRFTEQHADWKETEATVTLATVEPEVRRGGTSWYVTFAYDFPVGGTVVHTSSRDLYSTEQHARWMAQTHPAGSSIAISYSPANPSDATLGERRRAVWVPWAIAAGCLAIIATVVLIILAVRRASEEQA
jgi:hypothetical protein